MSTFDQGDLCIANSVDSLWSLTVVSTPLQLSLIKEDWGFYRMIRYTQSKEILAILVKQSSRKFESNGKKSERPDKNYGGGIA
jgi:hypothetical protein